MTNVSIILLDIDLTLQKFIDVSISLLALLFLPSICQSQQTLFNEEAIAKGIDCTADHTFWGLGLSLYDWDKDGWPDVSFCKTGVPPVFYHNDQGHFSEVQFNISNTNEAKHLLWVDYDNDGDADVFLTRSFGPWSLYRNNGSFVFTDVTASVGISQIPGGFLANAKGAAWSDINRDGFLDLYIATYHWADEITKNWFFLNNGGTSFSEMAMAVGIDDGYSNSMQPVFFDADMDGWPDLHVINDRTGHTNSFYRNNGDLTFTDESVVSGLNIDIWSMSNTVGDYDNDGDLDAYVTNKVESFPNSPGGNFLFQNDGNATFTMVASDSATQVWKFSWGAQWIDQDLDGHLDLFVSTSGLNDNDPVHSNHFARNNGDGTFEYRADSGMEDFITRTYCAATADFDNDGAPDLALSCKAPYRNELWRNNSVGHTYIKLSLEGTVSNRDAIGSTVRCYSTGLQQLHYTTCGEAYLSQNSQYILFGLNGATMVDSIVIGWPNGMVERLTDVAANQTLHLVEGFSQNPVGVSSNVLNHSAYTIRNGALIILEPNISAFEIYDCTGRMVQTGSGIRSGQPIVIDGLSAGIHFLRVIDDANSASRIGKFSLQ